MLGKYSPAVAVLARLGEGPQTSCAVRLLPDMLDALLALLALRPPDSMVPLLETSLSEEEELSSEELLEEDEDESLEALLAGVGSFWLPGSCAGAAAVATGAGKTSAVFGLFCRAKLLGPAMSAAGAPSGCCSCCNTPAVRAEEAR